MSGFVSEFAPAISYVLVFSVIRKGWARFRSNYVLRRV